MIWKGIREVMAKRRKKRAKMTQETKDKIRHSRLITEDKRKAKIEYADKVEANRFDGTKDIRSELADYLGLNK